MKKPTPPAPDPPSQFVWAPRSNPYERHLEKRVEYLEEMVEWLSLNIPSLAYEDAYNSSYNPDSLAEKVRKVRGE